MILLDPDLDPDSSPPGHAHDRGDPDSRPHSGMASPVAAWGRGFLPWAQRLPTSRTLTRFLAQAKAAARVVGEVNVLLTTDRAMRRMNRQFRGKDKPTDVLSFPASPVAQDRGKFAGDMAISVDTARRQGTARGHSLGVELKVLMLHGLLHLAGYDHESDEGRMARHERRLRARLGLPQGLIERTNQRSHETRSRKS